MSLILQVIWLAVPLLVTGGLHQVIVKRNVLGMLRLPLDAGATFRGRRIFGENKTWRGCVVMIAGCMIIVGLQALLYVQFQALRSLSFFDYSALNPFVVGAWMGLGYLLGELPNSFLKRQVGIEPGITGSGVRGALFALLDHTDSVLGFLLFLPLYWHPSWREVLAILAVGASLHVASNAFFYALGVRKHF